MQGHVLGRRGWPSMTHTSLRVLKALQGMAAVRDFSGRCNCGLLCINKSRRLLSQPQSLTGGELVPMNVMRQSRIARDGSLSYHSMPQPQRPEHVVQPTPILPPTAPLVPPISNEALEQLVDLFQSSRNVVVLTGAGCSTESNIPDYRGPQGAYRTGYTPMTHQQFMATEARRARYWARSFAGWHEFSSVRPNAAHEAVARLQRRGWVDHLVTQNVDRLHQKAGAHNVIELHGTTHEVECLGCGELTPRQQFQDRLAVLNPEAAEAAECMVRVKAAHEAVVSRITAGGSDLSSEASGLVKRPDGDVQLPGKRPDGDTEVDGTGFCVPPCHRCGGILKPRVVFFGDSIPPERSQRALELAQGCDAMLVVGSSLEVYSAFRLARAAIQAGARLGILTAGATRADAVAHFKAEALAGEALARLAAHPALLLPRGC